MKLSECTAEDVCKFLRAEETDLDISPEALLAAAKSFAVGYTGMTLDELDAYEDVAIAVLVLCADLYENRQLTVESGNENKVVTAILSMHCRNLL